MTMLNVTLLVRRENGHVEPVPWLVNANLINLVTRNGCEQALLYIGGGEGLLPLRDSYSDVSRLLLKMRASPWRVVRLVSDDPDEEGAFLADDAILNITRIREAHPVIGDHEMTGSPANVCVHLLNEERKLFLAETLAEVASLTEAAQVSPRRETDPVKTG